MNIIDGKQSKKWRVIEMIITISGWFVIIGFALQIILSIILWAFHLSNIYNQLIVIGNINDTIFIFTITIFISMLAFLFLYLWGKYNSRKYGKLNRRNFPKDVTNEDLAIYFQLTISEVKEIRAKKYVLLEKNIVD